jgi:RNA polymerase sigma factor (sigma-70 family)
MMNRRTGAVLRQLRQLAVRPGAEQLSDRELVDRFVAAGDQAAFEELVRRHGPMVWRVCLDVVRHEHDAEDAFQATFLVLARRASAIRKRASVASWLHGVARRVGLQARSTAYRSSVPQNEDVAMAQADPVAEATRREQQGILHEELSRLADKYRAPLVLCYLEGLTQDKAAHQLGLSKGTFRRRLDQGRGLLQARLARRGIAGVVVLGASSRATPAPAALMQATVRAALAFARSSAVLGGVSAKAVALAEGVLRATAVAQLKIWAVLVAVGGTLVAGTGVLAHQAWIGRNPASEQAGYPGPARAALPPEPALPKNERFDAFGDPLPEGVQVRLGTTRLRVGNVAWQVTFSPNGRALAAGGDDCVRLWETATGKLLLSLKAPGGRVIPVAFAPDGKTLAGGYLGSTIHLWDLESGVIVREFRGEENVHVLMFSPDGRTLVCGGMNGTVRLWNVATGEEGGALVRPAPANAHSLVRPVAVFPDNRTIATADLNLRLQLWDAATGKELGPLDWLPQKLSAVAIAPTGNGGGVVATAETDPPTIRLWQTPSGQELRQLRGHGGEIDQFAFSADGRILAAGNADGVIDFWDVTTGANLRQVATDQRGFTSMAFSPHGRMLATWRESSIRLWEVATGAEQHPFAGHRSGVIAVAFGSDNQGLVSVGMDGTVRQWNAGAGESLGSWGASQRKTETAAALSPDGRLLASGNMSGMIRVSDLTTGKEIRRWQGHRELIRCLSFAPDGQTLASGGVDQAVALWDPLLGREVNRFADPVRSLIFSPDGRLLVCGCKDGAILLRQTATGQIARRLQVAAHEVRALAFSPDGKTLASAATAWGAPHPTRTLDSKVGRIDLWEVATGQVRWHTTVSGPRANVLAFAPDSRLLVWGGVDHQVRRWDVATGRELPVLTGHLGEIQSLTFSSDGTLLASGSMDATVLIWKQERMRTSFGKRALSPSELETLWNDLASADAGLAYRAVWNLASAADKAVPLLAARLRPAPAEEKPDERAWVLLDPQTAPPPELLRSLRSLEILERIGTPDAGRLLQVLGAGAAESPLTQEAWASLGRLQQRRVTDS